MVLALALAVGLIARSLLTRPEALTLPVATASAPSGRSVAGDRATPSGSGAVVPGGTEGIAQVLVIDVVGRVRHPGIVRLPSGARVADAVQAAGGAAAGACLQRINLARPLSDGEQVLVPGADDPLPAGQAGGQVGAGGSAAADGGGQLDLNAAGEDELDGLPGIGPVLAGRIVQWRTAHSRFSSVDELAEVAGIGPKLLSQLRPLVRV